jgi:hypothetical protein
MVTSVAAVTSVEAATSVEAVTSVASVTSMAVVSCLTTVVAAGTFLVVIGGDTSRIVVTSAKIMTSYSSNERQQC